MKVELPDGTKVGSILSITWHRSGAGIVQVETPYEARVLRIDGNRIFVRFTYSDGTEEPIEIDIETGIDQKYGQLISEIELAIPPANRNR